MDTEIALETFTCKYCGSATEVDPSDQTPPPDYCLESNHRSSTPQFLTDF